MSGSTGPTGAEGPTGATGSAGATGVQGAPGAGGPAARVGRATDQSIPTGVATAISFTSPAMFDTGVPPMFAALVAPTRLTAFDAGKYQVSGNVLWDRPAPGGDIGTRTLEFVKNRGLPGEEIFALRINQAGEAAAMALSSLVDLAVGDYIEMLVLQDSSDPILILSPADYSPHFMAARVAF